MERSGGETSFFKEGVTVTVGPVWAYMMGVGKKLLNRAIIAKSMPLRWKAFPRPRSGLSIAVPVDA
jgi:hypothetical protein